MKDGPVRRVVKLGALALFRTRLRFYRWQATRAGIVGYELGGRCCRSGKCCEAPAIRVSFWIWYLPTVRRLFVWWQHRINQFDLVETRPTQRVFVFRCNHFDWQTRQCDSYETRPGMCRDYPRGLLSQTSPEFFAECGYFPLERRRGVWSKILDNQELNHDQRERLRAGLFLAPESELRPNQDRKESTKRTDPDS